jgi:hypothetical protein
MTWSRFAFEGLRRARAAWPLVLCLSLTALPASAAQKWALLIGVGDYIHGTELDLKGPPEDVLRMEELLLSKFGYDAGNIRKLVDSDATKSNIVDAMRDWLIPSAKAGDTVLIYFSGHGSQVPDTDGDEPDGRDEVLCPADIRVGRPGQELSDDELNRLLSQVQATDMTVIVDACHAGTGTRSFDFEEAPDNRPMQYRAVDLGYPEPEGGTRAMSFGATPDGMDLPSAGGGGTRSLESAPKAFTLIASCAPDETSASTVFWEGMSRVWGGVLTHSLVKALNEADGETSYEELMADVLRDVKKVNRRQTPQVEGDAARPIFTNTGASIPARSYVRIKRVLADRGIVQMTFNDFGEAHEGSIYKVLGEDGKIAGRVRVSKVIGRTVDAEIIDGADRMKAPALAVSEFLALSDEKLAVQVGDFGQPSINRAMRERLERIDFVRVARNDSAYFDVAVKGKIDGSVLSLLSGYEVTAWIEEAGARSRAVTSVNVDEIMGVLRPLLENAYAIKKLTRMDNDSAPFRVSVWVTGSADPGDGQTKFVEMGVGDPVYFHFRSQRDAYLTLLNVGADGSITILFPNDYVPHNRVVAGKTYTIPTEEMGFELHLGGPPGQELVKAFATEYPLDLSSLDSQAVGGFRALDFETGGDGFGPSAVDGLAAALTTNMSASMGAGTRAITISAKKEEAPPPGTPTENWSTDYLIIDAR